MYKISKKTVFVAMGLNTGYIFQESNSYLHGLPPRQDDALAAMAASKPTIVGAQCVDCANALATMAASKLTIIAAQCVDCTNALAAMAASKPKIVTAQCVAAFSQR